MLKYILTASTVLRFAHHKRIFIALENEMNFLLQNFLYDFLDSIELSPRAVYIPFHDSNNEFDPKIFTLLIFIISLNFLKINSRKLFLK